MRLKHLKCTDCDFVTNSQKLFTIHRRKCQTPEPTLDEYTVAELREMAEARGMETPGYLRKSQIIELLTKK